jgi:polyketide biosynthesis enoyl-CoA hydratase PksI
MTTTVRLLREGDIGLVLMEEKEQKNTFSPSFIQDLQNTFDYINQESDLKVIILQGYDNYFCCGGTKDELLGIFKGEMNFNDLNFYDILFYQ